MLVLNHYTIAQYPSRNRIVITLPATTDAKTELTKEQLSKILSTVIMMMEGNS